MEQIGEEQCFEEMEATSTSSSDDENDELEQAKASDWEQQIFDNPYLYDAHVELTELYEKLGELQSLRAAYERFQKVFPLTASLWLKWIRVEIGIANTDDEKKYVLELFSKAVEDYQSVELWQEYCQFSIGNCSTEETRAIFENGLNSVGLHVSQGSVLWNMFREFESAHLALANPETEQFQTQLRQVAEIFRRQLSIPLLDMENVMKEWQDVVDQLPDDHGIDPKPIEWGYKKALQLLETFRPYEKKLLSSEDENEKFSIYLEYISKIKDPSLIVCTFERAIAEMPLNVNFWEEYCHYSVRLGELAVKVTGRSLRNCPWSSDLWSLRLKTLEINNKPESEMLKCFEEALESLHGQNLLDLWLTYTEYVRRLESDGVEKLMKIFARAKEQIGPDGDPTNKLLRFWARISAKNGDMASARKLWSEIMHIDSNRMSGSAWTEYLTLEKQFGQPQHVRNLYQRAISNCADWKTYFADEWLLYERETATAQDVIKCTLKCKKILTESAQRWKRNAPEQDVAHDLNPKVKRARLLKKEKPVMETPCIKVTLPPTDIEPSKTVFVSNLRGNVTNHRLAELFPKSQNVTIPTDRKGASRCYAYVVFEREEDVAEALQRDREPIDGRPMFVSKCARDKAQRQTAFKYDTAVDPKKLFVKGLPLDHDQEAVASIFKPYGATGVRLVTKFNGLPRGLAYVDFATDDDAAKAMAHTDQTQVGECTITVAISAPPARPSGRNSSGQPQNSDGNVASHPKNRLQIAFVPRSVQARKGSTEQESSAAKSNQDFRDMINIKK